jgi:hypothetical protein
VHYGTHSPQSCLHIYETWVHTLKEGNKLKVYQFQLLWKTRDFGEIFSLVTDFETSRTTVDEIKEDNAGSVIKEINL